MNRQANQPASQMAGSSLVLQEGIPLQLAQWVFITLISAPLLPALYLLNPGQREEVLPWLYAYGWLLLPFVALLRILVTKTRSYGQYLVLSFLALSLAFLLACQLGRLRFGKDLGTVYACTIFLELLFVTFDSDALRRNEIRRKKARLENDTRWVSHPSLLEEPTYSFLWIFLLGYLFGLGMKSPILCDINLFSAFFYLPLCIASQYHLATRRYLEDMHSISNLPLFRMRAVGRGALILLLLLVVLFMSPALLTRGLRHYGDIREWKIELPEREMEHGIYIERPDFARAILSQLPDKGTPTYVHEWVNYLFELILLLCLLFLLRLALGVIISRFKEFSSSYDEGDIIISLSPKETKQTLPPVRRGPVPRTERERIRRQYRKTIRRHRKSRPLPPEMPIDIETKAGIAQTQEGMALHQLYERARYGDERQELSSLPQPPTGNA